MKWKQAIFGLVGMIFFFNALIYGLEHGPGAMSGAYGLPIFLIIFIDALFSESSKHEGIPHERGGPMPSCSDTLTEGEE